MTPTLALAHAASCTQARLEKDDRELPADDVLVTTWRCLDCGAFGSDESPLLGDWPEDPEDRGEAVGAAATAAKARSG